MSPSRLDWARARELDRIREGSYEPPLPTAQEPSPRQLRYIENLCKGNGVEYVAPKTRSEASLLIQKLLADRGLRPR